MTVYVECLERRCLGETLERAHILGPSLLRTALPPVAEVEGKVVVGVRRLGKRVVLALADRHGTPEVKELAIDVVPTARDLVAAAIVQPVEGEPGDLCCIQTALATITRAMAE